MHNEQILIHIQIKFNYSWEYNLKKTLNYSQVFSLLAYKFTEVIKCRKKNSSRHANKFGIIKEDSPIKPT